MAFTLIPALISIAASLAAAALKPRAGSQNAARDWTPTTIGKRGCWIPNVYGTMRVAPVFGWAGSRQIVSRKVGSTGGPSGKSIYQDFYLERGWHQVCRGPVKILHEIIQDGKTIWKGPIYQEDSPMGGVLISTSKYGRGYWYWGTDNQNVNGTLANHTGIASRWKKLAYMFWNRKELGTSARWPQVDYVVTCEGDPGVITSSGVFMDPSTTDGPDSGGNAAHWLYWLLTGCHPCGAGLDPSWIDKGALEALALKLEEEHLASNFTALDGYEIANIISDMMADFGFVMPQVADKLVPMLIRASTDPVPVLTNDVLEPDPPERVLQLETAPVDRLSFVFSDRQNKYEQTDIPADEDSVASTTGSRNTKTVQITTVNDRRTAQKVANRREAEFLTTSETYTLNVNRNARNLYPGQRAYLPGIGNVLVVSRKPNDMKSTTQLKVMYDQYSGNVSNWTPPDVDDDNGSGSASVAPVIDTYQKVIQLPTELTGGQYVIGVLRTPAHEQVFGAHIWISIDGGTNYEYISDQYEGLVGATLNEAYDVSGTFPDPDENGPFFISDDDWLLSNVRDLTGQETEWESGKQLLLVDDEIMFLQRIEAQLAPPDNLWQAKGIFRAGYGTTEVSHASGALMFIIPDLASIQPIMQKSSVELIEIGDTLKVKIQPFNDVGEVELADCPVHTLTIVAHPT